MGRGRAKAKQTKVARELKYFSPDTDLNALERELRASTSHRESEEPEVVDTADDSDDSDVGADGVDGVDDDYADWASHRH
ncbi:DUF3073 domain-containing protein [Calidifontibacter terrae]